MSQFGAAAADIIAWTCLPAGLSIAEIERERGRERENRDRHDDMKCQSNENTTRK